MDEKIEEKGKKKEPEKSAENNDEGNKPKSTQLIDDANLAAKRMEDATASLKTENDRQEKIVAEAKLGGVSDGQTQQVKKEETPKEYNDRIDKEISEGQHDD